MSDCHLCGSDMSDAVLVGERARYGYDSMRYACRECGLIQVLPQPSVDELTEFYRSNEYRREHGEVGIRVGVRTIFPNEPGHAELMYSIAENRVKLFDKAAEFKPGDRVLEVGSGDGRALRALASLGTSPIGIETDELIADKARRDGCEVFTGTLDEFESDEKFKGICAFHVLEHLPDPVAALRKLRGMLDDDGFVALAVPNVFRYRRPEHDYQWVHLFDFVPETLRGVAKKAGLDLVLYFNSGDTFAVFAKGDPEIIDTGISGEFVAGWLAKVEYDVEEAKARQARSKQGA